MKNKQGGKGFRLEILGGVIAIALIVCALFAFLELDKTVLFFMIALGLGILLNGNLAYLQFCKKNYPLSIILSIITVALLVLFVLQILLGGSLI